MVVPTSRRPLALAGCLAALAGQDLPHERFEVIVVHDGRTELNAETQRRRDAENRQSLAPRQSAGPLPATFRLREIWQEPAGPAAARNRGAALAGGRYLAFTDDDCAPPAEWLGQLAQLFEKNGEVAIGGRLLNGRPENEYATTTHLLLDFFLEYHNAGRDSARFLIASNLALPRELFEFVGGFDEGYRLAAGEDRDFSRRLGVNGARLRYAPELGVWHYPELNLAGLMRQHFRYGRGAHRFRRSLPAGERPEWVTGWDFQRGLWQQFLTVAGRERRWLLLPLLGLSQAATAAGYGYERLMK